MTTSILIYFVYEWDRVAIKFIFLFHSFHLFSTVHLPYIEPFEPAQIS